MENGSQEFDADVRVDVVSAGVAHVRIEGTEEAMGFCDAWSSTLQKSYFCGVSQGAPVCWANITTASTVERQPGMIEATPASHLEEGDLEYCGVDEVSVRVRDAVPERVTHEAVGVDVSEDGISVTLIVDDADVRDALGGAHAIRSLPCLLDDPPAAFGCPAGG